jgi:hypothetical protein
MVEGMVVLFFRESEGCQSTPRSVRCGRSAAAAAAGTAATAFAGGGATEVKAATAPMALPIWMKVRRETPAEGAALGGGFSLMLLRLHRRGAKRIWRMRVDRR